MIISFSKREKKKVTCISNSLSEEPLPIPSISEPRGKLVGGEMRPLLKFSAAHFLLNSILNRGVSFKNTMTTFSENFPFLFFLLKIIPSTDNIS